ncbi:MAG: hypothetical protein NTW19_14205 [Planctomycetota bacterium]|nr:hypothetical protein [Planctomycetota bacterium]
MIDPVSRRLRAAVPVVMIGLLLLTPASAHAWLSQGHARVTRAAVESLPPTLPAFLRENVGTIVGASLDPDAFRSPLAPELTAQEGPEHFFDLEMVFPGGAPASRPATQATTPTPGATQPAAFSLPPNRYGFLALCRERNVEPNKVGLLPYAVTEWTQRLAVAFAEHRRWPDDPAIKARCLVYAGILAHYAEDLTQPLHVTMHYDGRADAGNRSPRSGIHFRVDALLGRPEIEAGPVDGASEPQVIPALLVHLTGEIARSNAMVDQVYAMEKDFPPGDVQPWTPSPAVKAFGVERLRAATSLTASLYLTAWDLSSRIKTPDWLAPGTQPATWPAGGSSRR